MVLTKALLVQVRSTKTCTRSSPPILFRLPRLKNSLCCPVRAWHKYLSLQLPKVQGPALLLPTGDPLTARHLTSCLHTAATSCLSRASKITLHSLRRGAVQACQSSGLRLPVLAAAGTWKSDAICHDLAPAVIMEVPAALGKLLGER